MGASNIVKNKEACMNRKLTRQVPDIEMRKEIISKSIINQIRHILVYTIEL